MKSDFYKNFQIFHFENLDSTNLEARKMWNSGQIKDGSIIVADTQNKGRGRLNRDWISQNGNLFFSCALKIQKNTKNLSELSFVAAISLQKAIKNLFSVQNNVKIAETSIKNKWPNDILINDKKISGILLESEKIDNNSSLAIVGIGVNLTSSPENVMFKADNLQNFGIKIEKIEFLHLFLDQFEIFYQKWQDFGFAPIKNIWLENAWKIGEKVDIGSHNQKISGIFKEIDDLGNILIEGSGNIKKLTFGDVS